MAISTKKDILNNTTTWDYYYIIGPTFYSSTGETSGWEAIVENNGGLPDIHYEYSLSYVSGQSNPISFLKENLEFTFVNFGEFKNNESYPKKGTFLPGQELPPPLQPSPIPLTPYSFPGTVISKGEQSPLSGAKIEDSRGKTTTSDVEGKFIIEGDYYPTTPLKLTISLKDYGTETTPITNQKGGIRKDKGVFKLKTTKVSADDEILKNKGWNENQINALIKMDKKDFIKAKSQELLQTIKVKLTPYIILELAKLGVPNPSLVLSMVEKMSDKEERQKAKAKAIEAKEKAQKAKEDREKRKLQKQQEKEAENQQQT